MISILSCMFYMKSNNASEWLLTSFREDVIIPSSSTASLTSSSSCSSYSSSVRFSYLYSIFDIAGVSELLRGCLYGRQDRKFPGTGGFSSLVYMECFHPGRFHKNTPGKFHARQCKAAGIFFILKWPNRSQNNNCVFSNYYLWEQQQSICCPQWAVYYCYSVFRLTCLW